MKVFAEALKQLRKNRQNKKNEKKSSKVSESLFKSGSSLMAGEGRKEKSKLKKSDLRSSIGRPPSPPKPSQVRTKRSPAPEAPGPSSYTFQTPDYAGPTSKIGTNIKKRVRRSTFGVTQLIEGHRSYQSGQAEEHQFGTQATSTGGDRRKALGGTFGAKIKAKASSDANARSLVEQSHTGRLNTRKKKLGGGKPAKKHQSVI